MINNLEIVKASPEELPGILKLYAQSDIDSGNVLPLNEALAVYHKFLQYPHYHIYAAKIDNTIIGTFELLIMDNLAHMGRPSGIIEDVVVDMNCRSQGIGRRMIEFAINVCRDHGCYKLSLSSNIMRKEAHRFYENLGFEKHGYSFTIHL